MREGDLVDPDYTELQEQMTKPPKCLKKNSDRGVG